MDHRHFDTRSCSEINAEYVSTVHKFPEHLALTSDSDTLKYFHMQLVTVSAH